MKIDKTILGIPISWKDDIIESISYEKNVLNTNEYGVKTAVAADDLNRYRLIDIKTFHNSE